jgi:hypothetical protein
LPAVASLFAVGCAVDAPTYWADVQPIVDAHCGACHEGGGIAPFSLTSYEEVSAVGTLVAAAVEARTMPPWGADGGLARTDDLALTDAQIDTITAWVDGGMAEGDPADGQPTEPIESGEQLEIQQVLSMPEPWEVPAGDSTRCFPMDWPYDTDMWVTGQVGMPDNSAAVYHIVLFAIAPDSAEAVRAFDDASAEPGYPCYGGVELAGVESTGDYIRTRFVGDWAPGLQGTAFPAGTGIRMPVGTLPVLQVHYNHPSGGVLDQTAVGVRVADTVTTEGYYVPWFDTQWLFVEGSMRLPAGQESIQHQFQAAPGSSPLFLDVSNGQTLTGGMKLWRAFPHMHLLGQNLELASVSASGDEELLLGVPRYDFRWQREYGFAEPYLLGADDELRVECTWSNTEEFRRRRGVSPVQAIDVDFGESTYDEMCLAIVYVTAAE